MAVPVNSVAPTISGTIRAHETLTGTPGTWDSGVAEDSLWQLADDDVGTGAADAGTDETFVADQTQEGLYIRYGETWRNAEGTSGYVYTDWELIGEAVYTNAKHFICGSVAEIEEARDIINAEGTGGAIGILPGDYNLKSLYRKELEIDPATATIPSGATAYSGTYALYFSSANVTIYAVIPGTVRLYGESDAIVNSNTSGPLSAHRGGMVFFDDEADNCALIGLDIDGTIPYSATFDINDYCDKTDEGVDCWDLGHKAVYSRSPDARIIDCDIHGWRGEMIYGGSDAVVEKLEIGYCRLYDNQVSAISGTWQLTCHHNEFHNLYGQVMEGLHSRTCRYYSNYLHDIGGGGFNILGPVTALVPAEGWVVDIYGNVFENMTSTAFGAVYLSKQTTPDVSPPENTLIRNNIFRDVRTGVTVSLGASRQTYCENNLFLQDAIATMECVVSKSGTFNYSQFSNNHFRLTQNAVDNGYDLTPGSFNTGNHTSTRVIGNTYENCPPSYDVSSGRYMYWRYERYEQRERVTVLRMIGSGTPEDVPIPEGLCSSQFFVQFVSAVMYFRMTTDTGGSPYYEHGTELFLRGYDDAPSNSQVAVLIDGRGCQLKGGFPVVLGSLHDYVLLRYDANLMLWVEVRRETPRANSVFKLYHSGTAANIPLFGNLATLTIDSVDVIDAAFHGWRYFETDTNTLKLFTDSGWQTVWAA